MGFVKQGTDPASPEAEASTSHPVPPEASSAPHRSWPRRMLPASLMLVVTAIGVVIPLRGNWSFYNWDDTAGAAIGVWHRVAEQYLAGTIPMLQLDMWRGGNFTAEAATGMWNPVMVALMIAIHPVDDLSLGITIAKGALLLLVALGVYLLAREYGAGPWASAAVGVAMPLSGYTLFMDGTSWVNGLAITAFTPWLWWAARRHLEGRGQLWVSLVAGGLLVSTGNPYGLLVFGLVIGALGVESLVKRRPRRLVTLGGQTIVALAIAAFIYLPFLLTAPVGHRTARASVHNNEFFSPGLSDLMGMSTPGFEPYIAMFGGKTMSFPGLYIAWFLLPVLPWIRWRRLGSTWREWSGVAVLGAVSLLIVLGPSQVWMFRWPARLLPFLAMALLVIFALAMTNGFHRDAVRRRSVVTACLILFGGWLAYSDRPHQSTWAVASVVGVAALTVAFLLVRTRALRFGVVAVGAIGVLLVQTYWMPVNRSVAYYNFPTSAAGLQENFGSRYEGLTVQVATEKIPWQERTEDGAWQDLLFGNMYAVAGVESTTAYSGIGFRTHDQTLCLAYNGWMCAAAWETLWEVPEGETAPYADLLRVETVVVQKGHVASVDVPPGWELAEETDVVWVLRRADPPPFQDGRVSSVTDEVDVVEDVMDGPRAERLVVSTSDAAEHTVTFSRLAWPGYTITVDGSELEPRSGPAGLLQVDLPANLDRAEVSVSFEPPGWRIGMAALGVAGIGAASMLVADAWLRRRGRTTGAADAS
ncbi:conserved hypothetical protein [Beutenbergia cavernae DSM 12333]|uniref:Integral membrane protein n=1 Tax=Beutenbergia cavernae (strain ATCC BAA-8 / DSM 12333 / CCUG 43141 / JCM 11478 / NBRC 16432 / NCIMB 13614 / HKI 0122) TaxID=471853 RepID=C5C133_BEUC1|nr:hypothetical protein [Beutenbergia cavernae]ACQ79437.1 conserved hypothetical protein [Beutenbergia cavernae DSM 12333]